MKFVDPKTDIAFKKIFGDENHKNILIDFLNQVLELEYPITDIQISTAYQPPRLAGLKETSLDIKAKDSSGREFLVEIQVEKEAWFCQRALYYSSKSYSQQLGVGHKYHLLKPVIFLGILDFITFDHQSPFSRHLILNNKTGQHDLTDLEFNFIELPKFTKSETELETAADKWIYFLKQTPLLDHIPNNADSEALRLAYQIAEQHAWTQEELDIYEAQEIKLEINRNVVETAHNDGKAEGLAEAKLEVARNLLLLMDDVSIAQVTQLDLVTIAQLRQKQHD